MVGDLDSEVRGYLLPLSPKICHLLKGKRIGYAHSGQSCGVDQLGKNANAGNASNFTLYASFAVVDFFTNTVINAVGIRISLSFNGLRYCVYVNSYLCYNHTRNFGYISFAGWLLRCCADFLWSAQSMVMMSYLSENLKDPIYLMALNNLIFNIGAVISSLLS